MWAILFVIFTLISIWSSGINVKVFFSYNPTRFSDWLLDNS